MGAKRAFDGDVTSVEAQYNMLGVIASQTRVVVNPGAVYVPDQWQFEIDGTMVPLGVCGQAEMILTGSMDFRGRLQD